MFLFSAIELGECLAVFHWHKGFAGASRAIAPRDYDFFEELCLSGSVWAARDESGNYLAVAYSTYDEVTRIGEIGGLMVDLRHRGNGLGSTVARLALAHTLLEESLLEIPGARIIARVLSEPQDEVGQVSAGSRFKIIEDALKFRHCGRTTLANDVIPGLRNDDGFFLVDEYELVRPQTVQALAAWAAGWTGFVGGGNPAMIEFREGISMAVWAEALQSLRA